MTLIMEHVYNVTTSSAYVQTNDDNWTNMDDASKYLKSDLSPQIDYILGVFFLCSGVLSITLNSLLLFTISKRKRKCHSVELLIINMSVCDLLQSCLCLPAFAAAAFNHGWHMGFKICIAEAFLVFYFGCVAIWNLTAMSVIRYIKTCHPSTKSEKSTSRETVLIIILVCYVHSAVWCVSPLVGWGEFGPEPFGISCTISWVTTPLSYIVGLFVTCYGIPIFTMLFCYLKMIVFVNKMSTNQTDYRKIKEGYLTKMVIIMCVFFLITWTPYAITALMYIGGVRSVPHILSVGSPIFAKTSLWTNPFVYFFAIKRFRLELCRRVFANMPLERESSVQHTFELLLTRRRKSAMSLTISSNQHVLNRTRSTDTDRC